MSLPAQVYHLAEAVNWPSIQRRGLLSAARLITEAGGSSALRRSLEREQRLEHTVLSTGVAIRDQRPMAPTALARCLVGMTPEEWYALVNSRVFFWCDPDRLNRQRRACEPRPQVVLVVGSAGLIEAHRPRVALTPINTGNARRKPARRSGATFVSYDQWLTSAWTAEAGPLGVAPRSRTHAPVELTILDAVPDVMRHVVAVVPLAPGQAFAASNI